MVPVSLRLENFLSYGTAAPVLDFEQFRVACLSGRNGQGKSALLDAITWALWGEARKSSDSRKPDEELLRIGARRMVVELVFDLEGERYRVLRWFEKTKTGKTHKSGLEAHVFDPAAGEYRPLTGASMRETQKILNNVIGLDYDTFINSAFLLQGRSDEFTKKKPGERKQILARILNLGRYDRLADMARERVRKAEEAMRLAEVEIERLRRALEAEPSWKAEHARVSEAVAEVRKTLDGQRAEEKTLTERLAAMEAQARAADTARQSLQRLDARRRADEEEAQKLRRKIAEAERLLAMREEIKRDYERYETLKKERDVLMEKQILAVGVERQIQQRQSELKDRKNELEKQIQKLEVQLKADRESLRQCEAELVKEGPTRRLLEQAKTAAEKLAEMSAVRERRGELEAEIEKAERELIREKEALLGRIRALEADAAATAERAATLDALRKEETELCEAEEKRQSLQKELEQVRAKGQALAERIREREGQIAAHEKAVEELEETLARITSLEEEACPTCGTALTPEHRARVEARFREDVAEKRRAVAEARARVAEEERERQELRAVYAETNERLRALASVPERLSVVRQKIRDAEERRDALEAKRKDLERLRARLAAERFGEETRARMAGLRKALDELPFDEAAYEALKKQAAQVDRYDDQMKHLEEVAGRKRQLEKSIARKASELERLRKILDDGSAFAEIRKQLQALEKQLRDVGFDGGRLEAVRQALREIGEAGERMKELMHARDNRDAWVESVGQVEKRLRVTAEEREGLVRRLAQIEAELAGREALAERQRALARASAETEAELHRLQVQIGKLNTLLEQARRDREALKARRKEEAEARAEYAVYRHLRAAFGKHGIPSLIIEQTLPEIEDRANELLDRLTEGKMHVRLNTLKDKKSGGTKETLDIIITDEQGVPRPYETFSGGEAFRVNFALRIALAQLLAERSGVRVRTLVIDEGFGTQDAQGIENLVQAIQAIQDDFDKIIVITHLERLKEVFPVRIEVEKDPVVGSRFEIIGV
jgi:exonuclease SbcC